MISIKSTEKYDDSGRQFRIVICFRDFGRLRALYVSYFQSLESTKNFCLQ